MLSKLEKDFIGIGDVKQFKFVQLKNINSAYLYSAETLEGDKHYEVFKVRTTNVCIDFAKRLYSDTDFKEVYPKSKDFGRTAWCHADYEKASNQFDLISKD